MNRSILAVVVVGSTAVAAGCPRPLPRTERQPLFGGTSTSTSAVAAPVRDARPAVPTPTPSERARTLANGVVVETTTPGNGTQAPVGNDRVTLRYRSWRPELDLSTVSAFVGDLPRLPFGIADAIGTMVVGERARVWVPAVDVHGRDADPLVVDVELDAIQVAPPIPPDVAAPPAGATTQAGVAQVVVTPGTGTVHPTGLDEVVVSFTVWNSDGTMIETTAWGYSGARSSTWTVERFGTGVAEALRRMVVGETSRFWIPIKDTHYNDGSDAKVTYQIELLELRQKAKPPPTPKDVAKPPRSAKQTAKGVRYRFLTRGKSTARPGPHDRVRVHYSGWTTDGRMFDSSVSRGSPAVFPLDAVIAGWTDVLQVMARGDKLRAWIPEELAYRGQGGKPAGMLVFDIELLEIEP